MKKLCIVTLVGCMAFSLWFASAYGESKTLLDYLADEKGIEIQVNTTTDVYSQYIWRGMRLDNGYVVQPGITVSGYGFELGVWSSFDVTRDDGADSNEVDTSLMYAYQLKDVSLAGFDLSPLSITVGHIYYDFPGADAFSKEAVLGVAYDTFLSPSLTWYHDYSRESQGGGKGDYLVLEVGHSVNLIEEYGITLDIGGHAGYNRKLFIVGEGADVGISMGLSVPVTTGLTVKPSINYSMPFGGLADSDDGNYSDEFFWGIGLSYDL